ncbi:MAG: DUF7467 domain-containing protein [Planctomycetota bacterium]|jgi:hypothetical protein
MSHRHAVSLIVLLACLFLGGPPALATGDCPPSPCCAGDLHAVTAQTELWVGDMADCFEVTAALYNYCAPFLPYDQVDLAYCGPFPGPATGPNGAVTVEDVSVADGWATVRVRLVAQGPMFPLGRFGPGTRMVRVTVNGQTNDGCTELRCDALRPGVRFTPDPDCALPPCQDGDCGCKGKVTELTLRYDGATDAHIRVLQNKGEVAFDGPVAAGGTFEVAGQDRQGTLGPDIRLFVDGVENTTIHTSCSQPIGPGLVRGDFMVLAGRSRTGGELCPVGDGIPVDHAPGCDGRFLVLEILGFEDWCTCNPDVCGTCQTCGDCGPCDGKATSLTLRYLGSELAHVEVLQRQGSTRTSIFDGDVFPGLSFTVNGQDHGGTLGAEIEIYVNGALHTTIHTSCSQPLFVGLVRGDFEVVDGASREGGDFCKEPVDPRPVPT